MALSQKHRGKILVPWFNSKEWNTVYELIYSCEGSQTEGLRILKIWKRRMPLLAIGIEGTLIVLEALLTDQNNLSENILKSIYGTALMRFLNLCATDNEKQGTFYASAKRNRIPDWIIDLRHEFAHAHSLPSLSLLHLGLQFALKWLEEVYWSAQNRSMSDLIIEEPNKAELENLNKLFSSYCEITRRFYNKDQINFNEFLDDYSSDSRDKPKVRLILSNILKKIQDSPCSIGKEEFVNILLEKGDLLNGNNLNIHEQVQKLPRELLNLWKPVFYYFVSKEVITELLYKLNSILINWCTDDSTKYLAALWIKEILQILQDKSPNDAPTFKVEDLESFKETVLNDPNKHSLEFLVPLLLLCKCSKGYIEDTVDLVKSFTIVENSAKSNAINGFDSVQSIKELNELCSKLQSESLQEDANKMEIDDINSTEVILTKRWRKVRDTSSYSGPLGTIVGLSSDKNPICS